MLAARRMLIAAPSDPPSFVGSATAAATTSPISSLAVSSPTCAVGDLLLLASASVANLSATPTGWTSLVAQLGQDDVGDTVYFKVYTRTATSTDAGGTTYTANYNANCYDSALAVVSYRHWAIDASASQAMSLGTTRVSSYNTPTTTTTADAERIVEIWGRCWTTVSSGSTTLTGATPVPTQRAEVHGNRFAGILIADEVQASAGATTARSASTPLLGAWASAVVALKYA